MAHRSQSTHADVHALGQLRRRGERRSGRRAAPRCRRSGPVPDRHRHAARAEPRGPHPAPRGAPGLARRRRRRGARAGRVRRGGLGRGPRPGSGRARPRQGGARQRIHLRRLLRLGERGALPPPAGPAASLPQLPRRLHGVGQQLQLRRDGGHPAARHRRRVRRDLLLGPALGRDRRAHRADRRLRGDGPQEHADQLGRPRAASGARRPGGGARGGRRLRQRQPRPRPTSTPTRPRAGSHRGRTPTSR